MLGFGSEAQEERGRIAELEAHKQMGEVASRELERR